MQKVIVPQLNANDEECLVQQFHCAEEAAVTAGELLATLETSKAVIDVEADADGYFYPLARPDGEVKTGETLALIFPTLEELRAYSEAAAGSSAAAAPQYILSNQARELAELHGLSPEELSSLNKKMIKAGDLTELLEHRQTAAPQHQTLSKNQRQVLRTVTVSHQEIPRAFALMKVYCDELLAGLEMIGRRLEEIVGLAEVLPGMLAALKEEFPLLYGSLRDEETFIPAAKANIGITIDAGTGLYIPVIREEDTVSLARVVEVLAEYKYKALRSSFSGEELTDGCITISLNTIPDMALVLPMVLPGQTGMISVGAIMKELALRDGGIVERSFVHLGLAYDHRAVNGLYAARFLTRLKDMLEHFEAESIR